MDDGKVHADSGMGFFLQVRPVGCACSEGAGWSGPGQELGLLNRIDTRKGIS